MPHGQPRRVLGVQAIAHAAAYPGQANRAAQSQKLAATLASVIVSGDQAAANRAPALDEAKAAGAVEDAVKVNTFLGHQKQLLNFRTYAEAYELTTLTRSESQVTHNESLHVGGL